MAKCVFCQISNGELPAKIRFEDDGVVAFDDINPKAPFHVLIVPKKHIKNLNYAAKNDESLLGHMLLVAQKVAKEGNIADSGYKVVINNGKESGQLVDHLHMHLLGGKLLARMVV
jgi:histidine triad (HIT) family protein